MVTRSDPSMPISSARQQELRNQRHESRAAATYKQLVKDVQAKGFASEQVAEAALTSVVCALEQRLTNDLTFKFESQLPYKLRELMLLCRPRHELRPRDIGRTEFLALVAEGVRGDELARSFGERSVEKAVQRVLEVLTDHVTPGEIHKVVQQLPSDLRALWPEGTEMKVKSRQPSRSSAPRGRAEQESNSVPEYLRELDREWDVDRVVLIWFAAMGGVAFTLGVRRNWRWRIPLGAQITSLLLQFIMGWSPQRAILRRLGFRTRREIDAERRALLISLERAGSTSSS